MQDIETHEEIVSILKEMKRCYNYMAGDYDFVDAIVQWARQLTEEKKQMLLDSLFELSKTDDPLGGYFYDVIVSLRETSFAPRLADLLPPPQIAKSKHIEIVRTLMRLEYKPALPVYLDYIRTLLHQKDFDAFILLCHLYLVDPDIAIQDASIHFADFLNSSAYRSCLSAYIPCFLHLYRKRTHKDIINLVQCTRQQCVASGRQLAYLFLQSISMPYEREKFTKEELLCLEHGLTVLASE